jgi:hypothetical protein
LFRTPIRNKPVFFYVNNRLLRFARNDNLNVKVGFMSLRGALQLQGDEAISKCLSNGGLIGEVKRKDSTD